MIKEAVGVYMCIITFLGLALNGGTIYIVVRHNAFRDVMTMRPFLLNGIILDFVTCAFTYPIAIAAAWAKKWNFSDEVCYFYAFLHTFDAMNSIFQLTGLALERFITITKPLRRKVLLRGRRPLIMALSLSMFALLLAILPIVGVSRYGLEGLNISCSVNWSLKTLSSYVYIGLLFVLGYCIPIGVQLFCNLRFLKTVKVMRRSSIVQHGRHSSLAANSRRSFKQMTFMVAAMSIIFQVAWFPYALTTLLRIANVALSPVAESLPSVFAKSSVVLNPLVYCFMRKDFRSVISRSKRNARTDNRRLKSTSDPSRQ